MPVHLNPLQVAQWSNLADRVPTYALAEDVDLVLIRYGDEVSALYGRCLHRGALLSEAKVDGDNLICGLHGWDYRIDSGVSDYDNNEALQKFETWVEGDAVFVDRDEIKAWTEKHPQRYKRDEYLGLYEDAHGTPLEPHVQLIQSLAKDGLDKYGHHGPSEAMGVPRTELPQWDDLQILTAQLASRPLLDDEAVGTDLVIGPRAKKPLRLEIPIFVSDMSFGALSREAKVALARGAELAGTGICSGEGGMLPEEQESNSKYFYELASSKFGFTMEKVRRCQAFHFKGGQGAKTGTGGHLPGIKVTESIAKVRGLKAGQDAVSPAAFPDLKSADDFRKLADEVRKETGGIPIGFKISAQHIEDDIDFALEASADYIILDGRGGGTGSAPTVFRDNISVPTIPALARARNHLEALGHGRQSAEPITLIVTGGLRTPADFVKSMALGADGVAVSNSALQAIGCIGMRACNTNQCPVGIATQQEHLRARLEIEKSARRLERFFKASVHLMQVLSRACGHPHLKDFASRDLTSWKQDLALLAGVRFAGAGEPESRYRG